MSKSKPNNHEIPRHYLKGFCESGTSFLWVFERNKPFAPGLIRVKNNPARTGVKLVGLRNDGYAVPGDKPDYSYETRLQQEEHKADLPIKKVRNQESIDRSEKERIARYILVMRKRLSKRDQILDGQIDKALPLDEWQRELAFSGKFGRAMEVANFKKSLLEESTRTWLLRETMVGHSEVPRVLSQMTWNFKIAPNGEYFVTSDNPVIWDDMGLGHIQTTVIFPISKRVVLIAQWSQLEDLSYTNISAEMTRRINSAIIIKAIKEIYSPKPDEWIYEGLEHGFVWQ